MWPLSFDPQALRRQLLTQIAQLMVDSMEAQERYERVEAEQNEAFARECARFYILQASLKRSV